MSAITSTDPDLFSWSAPITPRQQTTTRRLCPFILSGLAIGGTHDLPTLVIDGTGSKTIETIIK